MEYPKTENIKVPSSEGKYQVCGSGYFTDKLQHMLDYLECVGHPDQLHFQLSANQNDDHELIVNIDNPLHYDKLSLMNEIKGMLEDEYKQYSVMGETNTSYNVIFMCDNAPFMHLNIEFTDCEVIADIYDI